jgi:hypothetical protein
MNNNNHSANKIVLEKFINKHIENSTMESFQKKLNQSHQNIKNENQHLIKNFFNKLKILMIFSN